MLYCGSTLPVFERGILPDTASVNMEAWYTEMLVLYQTPCQYSPEDDSLK